MDGQSGRVSNAELALTATASVRESKPQAGRYLARLPFDVAGGRQALIRLPVN